MINKYKKLHLGIGVGLIVTSLFAIIFIGPNISPEFSGSSRLKIKFFEKVSLTEITFLDDVSVKDLGSQEYEFQTKSLNDEEYIKFTNLIENEVGKYTITEFESFSSVISNELIRKSIFALVAAMIFILAYISFTFKSTSRPIRSWKYGVVSLLALVHDSIIPIGIFSAIALFTDASIDTLFVTALLATLGYSINDTIVIFDRIRERLLNNKRNKNKESFEKTVDYGVKKSFRRSIYTSLSTMIPLILLFLLVPVTKWFGIALFIGILAGTYSSLFFAPALLLLWHKWLPEKEETKRDKTELEKADEELKESIINIDTL